MPKDDHPLLPIHHGDLCLVEQTVGTELEKFSSKPNRVVVVGYLVEGEAFVYPVTTRRPNRHKGLEVRDAEGVRGWANIERGLFLVPISRMRPTGSSVRLDRSWHERIRRHLEEREVGAFGEPGSNLTHRPLSSLANLKRIEPPKPKPPPPKPRAPTDDEVWRDYLEKDLDSDLQRRAQEGRADEPPKR